MEKITDEQIVEAAKVNRQKNYFCDLVHSKKSRGVTSAYGIGFIEGAVWLRDLHEQQCHGCFDRDEVFRQGILHGQKTLKEDAAEGWIYASGTDMFPDFDLAEMTEHLKKAGFKTGDKVKLIIIKDDGGQV